MSSNKILKVGLVGYGAMAQYVLSKMTTSTDVQFVLVRPGRVENAKTILGDAYPILDAYPDDQPDILVDCAGHEALAEFGPVALSRGTTVITVSIGALADPAVQSQLETAATKTGAQLHLASGALGALDALGSAKIGELTSVTYVGRKPPRGWKGSPAEDRLNLDQVSEPTAHFIGTARDAALQYPKNANVAAAVALAGLGFDRTNVQLLADPNVTENIHEIEAMGSFGSFQFSIAGRTLPGNPRTSALAAMSVVKTLRMLSSPIVI